MKIYATVESERAKKGQGGDALDIVIYGEQRETLFGLKVTRPGEEYILDGYAISHGAPGLRSEQYIRFQVSGEKGE